MTHTPRIGVPVRLSSSDVPDARVGEANGLFVFILELLRKAGAEPMLLTPDSVVETELAGLDGVLLPGGGDLDPKLYGQEPVDAVYDVNPEQDKLDFAVARATLDAGLPLLGICRGHQLLNVLYGGTLIQDMLPSTVVHSGLNPLDAKASEWAWHDVVLAAGSRAAALYGSSEATTVRIASGHHQAVATVGAGLVVTAIADDGTIEALEDPTRWVASVQWHPEASQIPAAERLLPFSGFVEVCRKATQDRSRGVQ